MIPIRENWCFWGECIKNLFTIPTFVYIIPCYDFR